MKQTLLLSINVSERKVRGNRTGHFCQCSTAVTHIIGGGHSPRMIKDLQNLRKVHWLWFTGSNNGLYTDQNADVKLLFL